jgi:hypothetical protein
MVQLKKLNRTQRQIKTFHTMAADPEFKEKKHTVLVLDGGGSEALAYHIGFVSALILEGKITQLDEVFGVGPSAVLAARLAWAWPYIEDHFQYTTRATERSDVVMNFLHDPLTPLLLSSDKDEWNKQLVDLCTQHSKPLDLSLDVDNDSEVHSLSDVKQFKLDPQVTVKTGRGPADTMKVGMCPGSDIFSLGYACKLSELVCNRVYANVLTAVKNECQKPLSGWKVIVSSRCVKDHQFAGKMLKGFEIYPMDPLISDCAIAGEITDLSADAIAIYKRKGYYDCHRYKPVEQGRLQGAVIMKTPRKRPDYDTVDVLNLSPRSSVSEIAKRFNAPPATIRSTNACACVCSPARTKTPDFPKSVFVVNHDA